MSPYLAIDLDVIEQNARAIVDLCAEHGIAVTGVTKCVCGNPQIAAAMLRGGAVSIADSRLENIQRMRRAGIETTFMLLRLPPLSAAREVVDAVAVSLNSELAVMQALSAAAMARGVIHDVVLMVDLGDLREGIWPDDVIAMVKETQNMPGLRICGIGTNLACFAGVIPSQDNMQRLLAVAAQIERECAIKLDIISGINSSGLELIAAGNVPAGVNHARIGEAILLGRETTERKPWPNTFQDAFLLTAEILELKRKPSAPLGMHKQDAFGKEPSFDNKGIMLRALLNIGREDVNIEGITPLDSRFRILGASSGYLVLDATATGAELRVGDEVSFAVNYAALLAAMTSEYVKKRVYRNGFLLDSN